MTLRLYFEDSYCTRFDARVVERLDWDGQPAVVLDRSAFYPEGGGQLCDTGRLNGTQVTSVVEREADGAVVHILDSSLEADEVSGQIDWDRRFDLMQQHSGQHILSAAALEQLGATTVAFHLAEDTATIDLDRAPLSAEDLARVEARANAVVFADRPASARFVADDQIANLPLRKPVKHAGPVRIVEMGRFDCSACGGTHVRATGEVGLIKITRGERRGNETRIEFVCGRRALADYGIKNATVMQLAQELSVGYWELADQVHRMMDELHEARRELRRGREAMLEAEATTLWRAAELLGTARMVAVEFADRPPEELKFLAQRLIAQPLTAVLLGSNQGGKGHLVFARSGDVELAMGTLMRQACELLGGRGGGRPEFSQGGGADGSRVAVALEAAAAAVRSTLACSQTGGSLRA